VLVYHDLLTHKVLDILAFIHMCTRVCGTCAMANY